jgi:hypothetical protein
MDRLRFRSRLFRRSGTLYALKKSGPERAARLFICRRSRRRRWWRIVVFFFILADRNGDQADGQQRDQPGTGTTQRSGGFFFDDDVRLGRWFENDVACHCSRRSKGDRCTDLKVFTPVCRRMAQLSARYGFPQQKTSCFQWIRMNSVALGGQVADRLDLRLFASTTYCGTLGNNPDDSTGPPVCSDAHPNQPRPDSSLFRGGSATAQINRTCVPTPVYS